MPNREIETSRPAWHRQIAQERIAQFPQTTIATEGKVVSLSGLLVTPQAPHHERDSTLERLQISAAYFVSLIESFSDLQAPHQALSSNSRPPWRYG
jgi:hypothetical protein